MMKLFSKKNSLPKINWSDITIAKNKAIMALYDKYRDVDDDIMFLYELTAVAYGKPIEWIEEMKISEANEYANSLAFINQRPKVRVAKQSYTLNGHKYNVTYNMTALSTSQYIDFQGIADQSKDMPAEFLSTLLIPDGHKYNDGYDIEQVVYDIENYMNVEDCFALTAFFFTLFRKSIRRSIRRLKILEKKATKEGLMTQEQLEALRNSISLLESVNGLRR